MAAADARLKKATKVARQVQEEVAGEYDNSLMADYERSLSLETVSCLEGVVEEDLRQLRALNRNASTHTEY